MPALLALVLGRVGQWVAWGIIVKLIAAFGIGIAVYTGMGELIGWIEGEIIGEVNSAPANVVAALGMLRIDQAISIVFSAYSVRMAMGALGGIRRIVYSGTPSAP